MELVTGYINGRWISTNKHIDRYNPGNTEKRVYRYYSTEIDQAGKCMEIAGKAFQEWGKFERRKRKKYIREWIDSIESKTESFVEVITRENGKTLEESRDEVSSALKDARYLIAQFEKESDVDWIGAGSSPVSGGIYNEPVGVFLLLTPWNFPLSTLLRKMVPALLYGNTVVVKPSEFASATASLAFRCLYEQQKLPGGTANLIIGEGSVLGPALIKSETLCGISLTGSTTTGKHIQNQIVGRNVRFQMEMGGKNAVVVLADADLDEAVKDTVKAAFSCAGQWCTGTSRVIVEKKILQEFSYKLVQRVNEIEVGPGHLEWVNMGPVAHEYHYNTVLDDIDHVRSEGGHILTGGKAIPSVAGFKGWFIEPTVVLGVTPEMMMYRKEIFGPVLSLTTATDTADALNKVNDSDYGLAFSVYTDDRQKGKMFIENAEAGICHLNLHTAYRRPDLPIYGWKESGRGIPECGTYGKEFYTRIKSVYIKGSRF